MDKEQVRKTVNRLVEAREDLLEAETRLTLFTQSSVPPKAPSEFKTLQDFLDFHEERQLFEEAQQSLQTEAEKARYAYNEAESTLVGILPENAPLHYEYEGERQELAGVQFSIMNRRLNDQQEMVISSSGPVVG